MFLGFSICRSGLQATYVLPSILALDFSFSVGFPFFVVCLLGDFVVGLLGDIAFGFDGEEGFGSDGEDCFGPDGDSGEMVAVARVTPQEEDVSGL